MRRSLYACQRKNVTFHQTVMATRLAVTGTRMWKMADDPELLFEPFPSDDLRRFVEDNVATFTMAMTGALDYQPVGYFLRQERGEWVGGCMGYVWANYLHVQWLWVAASLRGRGHGAKLLRAAERMAVENGAERATLDTFNPAAKAFYLSHGYEVFGTLADYPPGYSKFFLRKTLVAPGNVQGR
jgi:ribosomal protein S18 acetylase RimI-like enzyme